MKIFNNTLNEEKHQIHTIWKTVVLCGIISIFGIYNKVMASYKENIANSKQIKTYIASINQDWECYETIKSSLVCKNTKTGDVILNKDAEKMIMQDYE